MPLPVVFSETYRHLRNFRDRHFPEFRPSRVPGLQRLQVAMFSRLCRGSLLIDGHRLQLAPHDVSSQLLAINGAYEHTLTRIMKCMIAPGDLVLDIGAHIGQHTLTMARRVGADGTVVAVEASSANSELLRQNLERNGYSARVHTVQCAAADRDREEKVPFFLSARNQGDHSLFREGETAGVEFVREKTIDTILRELELNGRKVSFIKMDIQGAEASAFLGMLQTLSASPGVVLAVEFEQRSFWRSKSDPQELLGMLAERFGLICEIDESRKEIRVTNPEQILREHGADKDETFNLICCSDRAVREAQRTLRDGMHLPLSPRSQRGFILRS